MIIQVLTSAVTLHEKHFVQVLFTDKKVWSSEYSPIVLNQFYTPPPPPHKAKGVGGVGITCFSCFHVVMSAFTVLATGKIR